MGHLGNKQRVGGGGGGGGGLSLFCYGNNISVGQASDASSSKYVWANFKSDLIKSGTVQFKQIIFDILSQLILRIH